MNNLFGAQNMIHYTECNLERSIVSVSCCVRSKYQSVQTYSHDLNDEFLETHLENLQNLRFQIFLDHIGMPTFSHVAMEDR
jgi:hypothetical protein